MTILRLGFALAIASLIGCGGGGGGGGGGAAAPATANSGSAGGGTSSSDNGASDGAQSDSGATNDAQTDDGTTGDAADDHEPQPSLAETRGLISGGVQIASAADATGVLLDVASGGSGLSIDAGDVQRIGSIVLNDETLDTDNAEFLIEGASGSLSDIRQGQEVLVISDGAGNADTVVYRSNIKGPVTSVQVLDAEAGSADDLERLTRAAVAFVES